MLLAACSPSVAEKEANEQARASAKAHNLLFEACLELQAVGNPDAMYDLDYGPIEGIIFQAEGLDGDLSLEVGAVVTGLADLDIGLAELEDDIGDAQRRVSQGLVLDAQGFRIDPEEFRRRLEAFDEQASKLKAEIDLACAGFAAPVDVPDLLE